MNTSKQFRLMSALIAAIAAAVLVPGLGGGFIFDDRPNIVQNAALHLSTLSLVEVPFAVYSFQPGNGSRMLSMASFAADHWVSGLDPRAFKVSNLLIHAITTVSLALLLVNVLSAARWPERRARIVALVVAAAWAVHPLQVSSVLYVVQRMQTLVTLFGILSLIAYVAMRKAQMEGRRSRHYGLAAILLWALGFASKEDAILYPAYALALELTVLRFESRDPLQTRVLRGGYLALTVIAAATFLLYVVPKYWHWDVMPGRDFTSAERVMTQPRVLMMHLSQSLVPLPSRMPFYYDTFAVSTSLLHPWTTLPSILILAGLFVWAWMWRRVRPVFAFGILLFFAGHSMTSNIFNLELAFEHRNHLPLIGILLAAGDLFFALSDRLARSRLCIILACSAVCLLAGATAIRAHRWGDPVRFAEYSLSLAPNSSRAWVGLAATYYDLAGGRPGSAFFDKAIEINRAGAEVTGSPSMYSNVVIYKSQRGDVTRGDWDNLVQSARNTPVTLQTQFILEVMLTNADNGFVFDDEGMVRLINAIAPRGHFSAEQYRRYAAYIHNETRFPDEAFKYVRLAVERAPPGDPQTERMFAQLTEAGREDWVQQLRQVSRAR